MSGVDVDDDALRRLRHDLSTPLTIVSGFAELLVVKGEAIGPEQRAEFAGRVAEAAREMRAILDASRD